MSENNDAPAPKPAPKLLGDRSRTIDLDYPVEFDGKTYERITVRRMTGIEVRDFIAAVSSVGERARLPMFDVPFEVIEALDDDDAAKLDEAVFDFLPNRLRTVAERTRESGAATSPSSQAS